MSNTHNLDENVEESFTFVLGGHTYTMRYPTTEEIFELQKIQETDPDDSTKVLEWMYDFVDQPDGAPKVKDALANMNIKVLQNFNKMIMAEFAIEN